MNMKIIGIGSHVPNNIVTNKELESVVDTNDKWIQEKLGIKERRISSTTTRSSDLAFFSSMNAINDSGLEINDIDFVILCTSSPDKLSPSTACILQDKLKMVNNAPCLDINAVCSGFIYGLEIAKGLLSLPNYKNILLVASETYSNITDWWDRTSIFFGDGSGAVILQKDDNNFCEIDLYGDGEGKEHFTTPIGGTFKMNGKEVYKNGITKLPESILSLLERTKIKKEDINHVIPHQPSINILKETAKIIDVPFEKFGITMDKYANTAGASIPITMDDMYKNNKFKKGDLLLLTAIGSGWVWGSGVIKWTK